MSRSLKLVLGAMLVAQGCGKPPTKPAPSSFPPGSMMPTPWMAQGVRVPPVKSANDVALGDDVRVVGVVVGGKARAYTLLAMSPPDRHIVNDLIGNVPVTISYCDTADCLRVFTDKSRGEPLEVSQMGRISDGLLLRYKGNAFAQSTGKRAYGEGPDLPLSQMKVERTSWKTWREKHPLTEIYTGTELPPSMRNS
jgi:hypothetical protein